MMLIVCVTSQSNQAVLSVNNTTRVGFLEPSLVVFIVSAEGKTASKETERRRRDQEAWRGARGRNGITYTVM